MKKPATLCLAVILFFACTTPVYATNTVTIAAFNIQIFGKTKAKNQDVMQVLAATITQFDVVAIQEIRDKSGTAIQKLESEIDSLGVDYSTILGPRLGRSASKEQYAFMYRTATIEPIGDPYTYAEPNGTDPFHREPLICKFRSKSGSFDFVLITIHTDPDEATEEIWALKEALMDAQANFTDEQDFIILGDLNSDCRYYDESQPNPIMDTIWLITNDKDTTVKTTVCTYDRIIITSAASQDWTGTADIYRHDIIHNLTKARAVKVSDHYPVYAEFFTNNDTD